MNFSPIARRREQRKSNILTG